MRENDGNGNDGTRLHCIYIEGSVHALQRTPVFSARYERNLCIQGTQCQLRTVKPQF